MPNWIFIGIMMAGGALLAFQSPTNAALGKGIGSYEAAFVSFLVGTVIAAVVVAAVGKGNLRAVAGTPGWQLLGGLYGIIYITLIILAVPKLGVTTVMLSVLLGQLATAMVIDHFGWFGVPVRELTLSRVCALPLVVGAVFLMNHAPRK